MGLVFERFLMAALKNFEFATRAFRCAIAKDILMLEECRQRHSTARCVHFLGQQTTFLCNMLNSVLGAFME